MHNDVLSLGTDLSVWTYIRTNDPRPVEGFVLEGFCSKSHARTIEGIEWSLARFYLNDEELFRAWGVKADLHCSAHLYCFDTQPRIGCPTVAVEDDEGGVGFLVLGENEKRYPVSIRKRL